MLDVGIGFGKRLEDNLQLLARLDAFTKWNRPLLLGASRKSFMGQMSGRGPAGAAAGLAGVRLLGRPARRGDHPHP